MDNSICKTVRGFSLKANDELKKTHNFCEFNVFFYCDVNPLLDRALVRSWSADTVVVVWWSHTREWVDGFKDGFFAELQTKCIQLHGMRAAIYCEAKTRKPL